MVEAGGFEPTVRRNTNINIYRDSPCFIFAGYDSQGQDAYRLAHLSFPWVPWAEEFRVSRWVDTQSGVAGVGRMDAGCIKQLERNYRLQLLNAHRLTSRWNLAWQFMLMLPPSRPVAPTKFISVQQGSHLLRWRDKTTPFSHPQWESNLSLR